MGSEATAAWQVREAGSYWAITFRAMDSPCEVLACCEDASEAEKLASLACLEAVRIERKFSRYRDDNIVYAINHSTDTVSLDEETSRLLRYADQCYELSGGLFDVTSGVLRRAWTFDGSDARPDAARIDSLRELVGWNRIRFAGHSIRLLPGMEIDLGGIGKEYAADRIVDVLAAATSVSAVMVNLGGDIRALGGSNMRRPWTIGIESPWSENESVGRLELLEGGVATSGDARRCCYVDGIRLGHILDPRTGWPVSGAPRSATVVAESCTAAGFLSTLAMLHGADAEAFLDAQGVTYHCVR